MRKVLLGLISGLLVATSLFAQSDSRRALTVDESLDMVRLENVLMSPSGRWVFYSASELDWDENKRKQKHYLVPADGGEAIPFIGRAGGSAFQFSPDGEYLSFLRSVDDKAQIFRMRMHFPREPHGFREPRHERTRDIEEIRWMQKYVMGIDWKPWDRKVEVKN